MEEEKALKFIREKEKKRIKKMILKLQALEPEICL